MTCSGGWYALLCGFLHINTNIPVLLCIVANFFAVVLLWNVPSYYFITWRRDVTAKKRVLPANTHVEKEENVHVEKQEGAHVEKQENVPMEKQENTHEEKCEVVANVASTFCSNNDIFKPRNL